MNENKHAPTDEFIEYLARDTMRRLRYEARFATAATVTPSRYRFPKALAVAAGVVVTLSTGMVLGASANYASAAVLPNGTTTIPTRPAFALLPIKNALTAMGCTQAVAHATAKNARESAATDAAAPATSTTDVAAESVVPQPEQVQVPAKPDRAMIAMLARQHQAAVVRGDTSSDYIVMTLDAVDNYLWSTHGNGNVNIEVGGDTRTLSERNADNSARVTEFWGVSRTGQIYLSDFVLEPKRVGRGGAIERDSMLVSTRPVRITGNVSIDRDSMATTYQYARIQTMQDSALRMRLTTSRDTFAAQSRSAGRGGGGRGGAVAEVSADSMRRQFTRGYWRVDSGTVRNVTFARPENIGAPCAGNKVFLGRESGRADSTIRKSYSAGWTIGRGNTRCNEASGMREGGNGESGLTGLPSPNVASADVYVFAAGELAPRQLRIMVVYLTPGTAWSGR